MVELCALKQFKHYTFILFILHLLLTIMLICTDHVNANLIMTMLLLLDCLGFVQSYQTEIKHIEFL